jgi:opacity protein-like surface antigen
MRLSYASGPIAVAIAVEDGDSNNGSTGAPESNFGVAGELKYSGDSFGVELNAGVQQVGVFHAEDAWTVNAGAHVALGDMFSLSAAAGMGSDVGTTDDWTKASLYGKANLSDAVWAEAGVSHKWNTQNPTTVFDVTAFGLGIYYQPVSQLTIGLEANYSTDGAATANTKTGAALVTKFAF